MFNAPRFERPYRGYVVEGTAEPPGPYSDLWVAVASVLLKKPNGSVLEVERYPEPMLAYEDGNLAAWFGLGVAEIAVDQSLPRPEYYLTPISVGRAVDILRRGAEDHHKREIRRPELYEALNFLEEFLDKKNWIVRRYRNALRGDTRNQREKLKQREKLRVRFRGIQHGCVKTLLAEINELALHYRKNRAGINRLRRQLAIVRRPIGL